MNEFDYDVRQRKRIASGAFRRKCGSKSRKCSLPTDYMTQKEWKERNGDVVSVNLNSPMSWKEFKALPADLQTEYIKHLRGTYHANATKISDMFQISPQTLKKHLDAKGVEVKFQAGKSMAAYQLDKWNKFVCGNNELREEPVSESVQEEQTSCEGVAQPTMSMKSFSLSFDGVIDVEMIANSLRHILGSDATGAVHITCDLAA